MLFAKLINFIVIIEIGILGSMEVLMEEADVGINNFLMRNYTSFLIEK